MTEAFKPTDQEAAFLRGLNRTFGAAVGNSTATAVPILLAQCRSVESLPIPVTELKFHAVRRWRFDVAFVDAQLAVEVDGGGFIQGRHSRGAGMEKDAEKYAEAAILGWTIIRTTPKLVKNGQTLDWIVRWFARRTT